MDELIESIDFIDNYCRIALIFISKEQFESGFSLSGKFIGMQVNSFNMSYLTQYTKGNITLYYR